MKSLSYVYKLIISGYVIFHFSRGLHHENPFTSGANLPPTAFKSAMFLPRRLFESAISRYIKQSSVFVTQQMP